MDSFGFDTKQWTEIYRPRHLSEIIGQDIIKQLLYRYIEQGIDKAPHLILHGPPGTGKTSLAMAFAADLYPTIHLPMATMYLNASDERSKTVVRERICEFLRKAWMGVTRKIIILDEVETMTTDAQLTLRALMDTPIISGTPLPIFIFLCNTVSRIVPLVRSRALTLFCGHLSHNEVQHLFERVTDTMTGTEIEVPSHLSCILNRGDMRAFLQKAQAGENPNQWISWMQRLLNSPPSPSRISMVWADGMDHAPIWLLIRHVLVLSMELGITSCINKETWNTWVSASTKCRTVEDVTNAWFPIHLELLAYQS